MRNSFVAYVGRQQVVSGLFQRGAPVVSGHRPESDTAGALFEIRHLQEIGHPHAPPTTVGVPPTRAVEGSGYRPGREICYVVEIEFEWVSHVSIDPQLPGVEVDGPGAVIQPGCSWKCVGAAAAVLVRSGKPPGRARQVELL